jgi:hypothetical protein
MTEITVLDATTEGTHGPERLLADVRLGEIVIRRVKLVENRAGAIFVSMPAHPPVGGGPGPWDPFVTVTPELAERIRSALMPYLPGGAA